MRRLNARFKPKVEEDFAVYMWVIEKLKNVKKFYVIVHIKRKRDS